MFRHIFFDISVLKNMNKALFNFVKCFGSKGFSCFLCQGRGVGTFWSAASICSCVHGLPQFTGHPLVAYPCRRGAAAWCNEWVLGHIRPCLPSFSFIWSPSGMAISFFIASAWCALYSMGSIASFGCKEGLLSTRWRWACKSLDWQGNWATFDGIFRAGKGLVFDKGRMVEASTRRENRWIFS